MSARAIRKLREDRGVAALQKANDSDDESDEDDDVVAAPSKRAAAFSMMHHDDDSPSSDESEEENEEDKRRSNKEEASDKNGGASKEPPAATSTTTDHAEKEENLDALLAEFQEQDVKKQSTSGGGLGDDGEGKDADEEGSNYFELIMQNMDVRDLDVDYVMRTSLLGPEAAPPEGNRKRRNRQTFLFGNPRGNNNNVKPPHYVGGGIGMSTYDREPDKTIPWPYNNATETNMADVDNAVQKSWQNRKRWFTFLHSDSFVRDCDDYRRIQDSGDLNALVMFVAHHPFVTHALVQLGMMLYHANQGQEGLTFLRRCVWVYESATLSSFTARVLKGSALMDYSLTENRTYFDALFKLARVHSMAGLPRSSFAIGRFVLGLDPLRDPTGMLLALDYYALASNMDSTDQWIVDFVESDKVKIHYRDEASPTTEYQCGVLDLPNWAYSYAMALYRVNDLQPFEKANDALKSAIQQFPSVMDMLLHANDVDVTNRSCRMDWQAVLDYTVTRANAIHGSTLKTEMDPVLRMAAAKGSELINRIFVKQSHQLWSGDNVLLWLYKNLEELKAVDPAADTDVKPLSPALVRYCQVDPADYETKFQLLPAEVNPLDPGLVNHALNIDLNRRRFLQGQRGGQRQGGDFLDENFLLGQNAVRRTLFGPPSHVIDLDWPLLEIFWRSLLPWNRIDEIPRPPR